MLAILAVHPPSQTTNTAYLVVWIIIGLVTIIGFGVGAVRWLRNSGKADATRIAEAQKVQERLDEQDAVLAKLEHAIRPNGLDSQEIGDIAKRTELAVERLEKKHDALAVKLAEHVGSADQRERELWRALKLKVDK